MLKNTNFGNLHTKLGTTKIITFTRYYVKRQPLGIREGLFRFNETDVGTAFFSHRMNLVLPKINIS